MRCPDCLQRDAEDHRCTTQSMLVIRPDVLHPLYEELDRLEATVSARGDVEAVALSVLDAADKLRMQAQRALGVQPCAA